MDNLKEFISNPALKIFGAYLRHISTPIWRNKFHGYAQLQPQLDLLLERPLGVTRNITEGQAVEYFASVVAGAVAQDANLAIYTTDEFQWMIEALNGKQGKVALSILRVNVVTRDADLWTVEKAAAELGMSIQSIRRWCDEGILIGATKQAKTWLIDPIIAKRVKEIRNAYR